MARDWPQKESDLGPPVVQWLTDNGWDVYQEVELHQGGARADIVGVRGGRVFVVELKKSLSLDVLAQAAFWAHRVHFAAVAVPVLMQKTWRSRVKRFAALDDPGRRLASQVCAWKGIGMLQVERSEEADWRVERDAQTLGVPVEVARFKVHETAPAPLHRRAPYAADVLKRLKPEHKTFALAGNADGRRWTPFRDTCDRLRRHVEANPGCTMREAVLAIKHHYASDAGAVSGLLDWVRAGKVEGVKVHRQEKRLLLYPPNVEPAAATQLHLGAREAANG